MAQVELKQKLFKVTLTEYDRWSHGPEVLETLYFDNETEAKEYAVNYNRTNNNKDYVPDCYIRADYKGIIR